MSSQKDDVEEAQAASKELAGPKLYLLVGFITLATFLVGFNVSVISTVSACTLDLNSVPIDVGRAAGSIGNNNLLSLPR